MPTVYLALGSNVGDRAAQLDAACQAIAALPGTELVSVSSYHETAPVGGPTGQSPFLNAACRITTELEPAALLGELQRIERERGRPDPAARVPSGPRTLDIDILLYDERRIDQPGLKVPHPRMHDRRFVLAPLAEIGPEAFHPVLGLSVSRMLAQLDEASE